MKTQFIPVEVDKRIPRDWALVVHPKTGLVQAAVHLTSGATLKPHENLTVDNMLELIEKFRGLGKPSPNPQVNPQLGIEA